MQPFDYVVARSLDDATSLLTSDSDHACILAGGTDLLIQLRENRRKTALVIDIKRIPEVNELTLDAIQGLTVGAAVPCYRICQDRAIAKAYPGLVDAVSLIGGVQIQGRASVGGNLCNASPAADAIPALIVHQAVCIIYGPGGYHEVAAENFCTAPGQTVLQRGELLVSLRMPLPAPGFGAHYLRFTPRNEMDIAVAGAGAAVILDESRSTFISARTALGAVAPTPLFVPDVGEWLAGRKVQVETINEAAEIAQGAARPIDDLRGTAIQRKRLSSVLTRRALELAVARARM
jgi:CO/xanthine dehydrogenase FAD-binding subunit